MIKPPSLQQLQYLVAIERQQSFSRAAKACRVSQPTLSVGIKALEANLGMDLIVRSNQQLRFTPMGQKVLELAQPILAQVEALVALTNVNVFAGTVTVGVIPTLLPAIIGAWLSAVQNKYPHLNMVVVEDTSAHLATALSQGELDYVLAATPFAAFSHPDFEVQALWRDPFYLVRNKQKTPKSEHLLLLEKTHCLSGHALSACARHLDKHSPVRFQMSSIGGLVEMVKSGLGFTYLPKTIVDYLRRSQGDYTKLKFEALPNEANRQISGIWRAGTHRRALFLALGDLAKRAAR